MASQPAWTSRYKFVRGAVVSRSHLSHICFQFKQNTYDVTTWDSYPVILGGNSSIENFYNDPRVKEKLHAPEDVHWMGCIPGAGRRRLQKGRRSLSLLEHDQPMSTVPYLAEMLDAGKCYQSGDLCRGTFLLRLSDERTGMCVQLNQ